MEKEMKRNWLISLIVLAAVLLASVPVMAAAPGDPPGLEKAIAAQERHQEALFRIAGVEGVGAGFNENNQPAVIVFTATPGARGVPAFLDGMPVKTVASGKFEALARKVVNSRPTVTIISPTNGTVYPSGSNIHFQGTAYDKQEGYISSKLNWTDNGTPIGSNSDFYKVLADGSHTIVASATDAGGLTGSATVTITVGTPPLKTTDWWPRPVPIGVSTGHPAITAGTIGARVKDSAGNVYALSNNHVYADENLAHLGDSALQPGPYDGGQDSDYYRIGTLAAFKTIVFSNTASNTIDAAIALSSTSALGNGTPSGGYGIPNSTVAAASVNMPVQKYGRTTGLTKGKVYAVNATISVSYSTGTARYINQIVITPGTFSAGGDSGSLIVGYGGAYDKQPVGLLFAGSNLYTIANPIQPVLTYFGVTIDGQ
jgi:hypothetical protein